LNVETLVLREILLGRFDRVTRMTQEMLARRDLLFARVAKRLRGSLSPTWLGRTSVRSLQKL